MAVEMIGGPRLCEPLYFSALCLVAAVAFWL
jgi:hypothetical protein